MISLTLNMKCFEINTFGVPVEKGFVINLKHEMF